MCIVEKQKGDRRAGSREAERERNRQTARLPDVAQSVPKQDLARRRVGKGRTIVKVQFRWGATIMGLPISAWLARGVGVGVGVGAIW